MKTLEKLLQVKEMIMQLEFLLDYTYFKDSYKMIVIDLSKQLVLGSDCRATERVNFAANLDRAGNTRICFILE